VLDPRPGRHAIDVDAWIRTAGIGSNPKHKPIVPACWGREHIDNSGIGRTIKLLRPINYTVALQNHLPT
jgi:hypothetical protein